MATVITTTTTTRRMKTIELNGSSERKKRRKEKSSRIFFLLFSYIIHWTAYVSLFPYSFYVRPIFSFFVFVFLCKKKLMEPLTHQPSAHLSVIICAHLIDQLEGKEREFVWKGRVGSGQQVIDPSLESIHPHPQGSLNDNVHSTIVAWIDGRRRRLSSFHQQKHDLRLLFGWAAVHHLLLLLLLPFRWWLGRALKKHGRTDGGRSNCQCLSQFDIVAEREKGECCWRKQNKKNC